MRAALLSPKEQLRLALKTAPVHKLKKCRKCGELKETAKDFNGDRRSRDGLRPYCRLCAHNAYLAKRAGRRDDAPKCEVFGASDIGHGEEPA